MSYRRQSHPGWEPGRKGGLARKKLPSAVGVIVGVGLGVAAGLWALSARAQTGMTIAPEAYVDRDGIWPSPRVSVCWEPSASQYTNEKRWVEEAVAMTIETESPVDFRGWGECRSNDLGVRIRVADEHPRSAVGQQWERDANGRFLHDALGRRVERPTVMVLNFMFRESFQFCQLDREHCIRAISVHEFLHALGFLHEQLRADAPQECRERFAHHADFPGYQPYFATREYDSDSHVNYCANMYRRPIRLSAGDVAVLREFYTTQ